VFDFGSEMYLWTGKHVPFDRRKRSLKLAVELWDAGYDYSTFDINPLCPLIRMHLSLLSLSCHAASLSLGVQKRLNRYVLFGVKILGPKEHCVRRRSQSLHGERRGSAFIAAFATNGKRHFSGALPMTPILHRNHSWGTLKLP